MNNKEIALSYLRQGLPVIPLKSPTMVSNELPATGIHTAM